MSNDSCEVMQRWLASYAEVVPFLARAAAMESSMALACLQRAA